MDNAKRQAEKAKAAMLQRENAAVSSVLRSYQAAQTEVEMQLDELVKKMLAQQDQGLAISQGWLIRRAQLNETLSVIQATLTAFATKALQVVEHRQKVELVTSITDSDAMFRAIVKDGHGGQFKTLTERAMADLVGKMGNGQPMRAYFARLGPTAAQSIESVLLRGLAASTPLREIAADLRVEAGMTRISALTTARTVPLQAYREGTRRAYLANSNQIRGWRWLAPKDSRTCIMCLAMDGTVHPLTESMNTHAACRCQEVPDLIGAKIDFGQTGTEWFADQSEERQTEMMGPGKFELYKAGKVSLPDFVKPTYHQAFGPGRRETTLRELNEKLAA